MRKGSTHLVVATFLFVGFATLGTVLTLLDVDQDLDRLLIFRDAVHLVPREAPQQALENMPNLDLEVVLVIVGPAEQGKHQVLEMWADNVNRERVDG